MPKGRYGPNSKQRVKRQRSVCYDDDKDTEKYTLQTENGICTTNGFNYNEQVTRNDRLETKCINGANQKSVETRKQLPNGIGFTPNTKHLRRTDFAERSTPYNPKLSLRHTIPKGSQPRVMRSTSRPEINCCLSGDKDLDPDGLLLRECRQTISYRCPSNVPVDYADSSPSLPKNNKPWIPCIPFGKQKQPDQVNTLYIHHAYQTDSDLGDRFGADLVTYKYSSFKYNQHLLCNVSQGGPADQMKIIDGDEVILVNNEFVPALTHTDVLNVFQHVKVDGKTRLSLVIRRRLKNDQWQWFETSALLFPDKGESHGIKEPIIKELHYQPLENNRYEHKTWCRFQVEGTQLFLVVNNSGVNTDILRNDKSDDTKKIMQWAVYRENPVTHIPEFVSSLGGFEGALYVAVRNNSIDVSNNPQWFQYRMVGSTISFKEEVNSRYIGFDRSNRKLTTQPGEYYFQRVPLDHDKDSPDLGLSDISPLSSQSRTAFSESFHSFSLSQTSTSSRLSSIEHSFESDIEMDTSGYESSSLQNSFDQNGQEQYEIMDMVDGMTRPFTEIGKKNRRITRSMSRQISATMHGFDNIAL